MLSLKKEKKQKQKDWLEFLKRHITAVFQLFVAVIIKYVHVMFSTERARMSYLEENCRPLNQFHNIYILIDWFFLGGRRCSYTVTLGSERHRRSLYGSLNVMQLLQWDDKTPFLPQPRRQNCWGWFSSLFFGSPFPSIFISSQNLTPSPASFKSRLGCLLGLMKARLGHAVADLIWGV